jgi:hypothetical protein
MPEQLSGSKASARLRSGGERICARGQTLAVAGRLSGRRILESDDSLLMLLVDNYNGIATEIIGYHSPVSSMFSKSF